MLYKVANHSGGHGENQQPPSYEVASSTPSFTNIALYGKIRKQQLLLSSLVEEFKTAKTRLVLTRRVFQEEPIREAGVETLTKRK